MIDRIGEDDLRAVSTLPGPRPTTSKSRTTGFGDTGGRTSLTTT